MPKVTAPTPKSPLKKVSGLKVTVRGTASIKGDRQTDVKKYEESFFLPNYMRPKGSDYILYIILRFLLPTRLKENDATFKSVRTQGIKTINIAEDTGFTAIQNKKIEDMNSEEMRLFVIFNNYPLELIQDVAIDFDLVERLENYLKDPVKYGPAKKANQDIERPVPGAVAPTKEAWEELDK